MNRLRSRTWSFGSALLLGMAVSVTSCVTTSESENVAPAVPPPRPTAAQETQEVLDGVRKSGDAAVDVKPILQQAADAAFTETFPSPADGSVVTERMGCFASGCLFQVTYRDRCAERNFKGMLSDTAQARLRSWPGMIRQTPPVTLPDGRVQVTWALLIADAQEKRPKLEALLKPAPIRMATIRPDMCAAARPVGGPATTQTPT